MKSGDRMTIDSLTPAKALHSSLIEDESKDYKKCDDAFELARELGCSVDDEELKGSDSEKS